MQTLLIQRTSRTPQVMLDASKGLIDIKGPCIVEDTVSFYEPILAWVTEYTGNPSEATVINLDLEYFNSSTSRILMALFRTLADIKKHGHTLTINWIYARGDEDLKETGNDFSQLSKIEFNLVERE